VDKFLEALGLGVPVYLAVVTYGVFRWLDNNASDEARRVVSVWLQGRSNRRLDLGNAVLTAFDQLYTIPLLRPKAFLRSAFVSLTMYLFFGIIPRLLAILKALFYDPYYINDIKEGIAGNNLSPFTDLFLITFFTFVPVVISDYLSLFFVRRFLYLARKRPIVAMITASTIGITIVTISFLIFFTILLIIVNKYLYHEELKSSDISNLLILIQAMWDNSRIYLLSFIAPAFLIHLWLPLFVFASLGVRLFFITFRAVEWAQWFLRQGDQHPLWAVGVIASGLVFVGAILGKEAWRIL
jgi:hypothetical protein